nr:hypothetical protein [Tanacetum cinerariifolium]
LKTLWTYSPKRPVIYHCGQEMDFKRFVIQGIDDEFNFLPEEASKVAGDASTPLDVDSDPDIPGKFKPLCGARASCDAIQERKIKRDKAYAEMEKKCNEALQDLDKNPLVSYMRSEIEVLQGQVNGYNNEYGKLLLKGKKWANYEQTMSLLRAKIVGLDSERERLKASEIKLLQEIDSLRHYMVCHNNKSYSRRNNETCS